MSIVVPRARTRPIPVDPPPRRRVQPVAEPVVVTPPPRRRALSSDWRDVIPNHLPLPFAKLAHNGYTPKLGDMPDPRFAPLVIVMNPEWLTRPPGYVTEIVNTSSTWTPDTVFPRMPIYSIPAFLYEWALRAYTGHALMNDETFAALEKAIIAHEHLDPKEHNGWNDAQRCVLTVADGALHPDMTKATGPFYLDGVMLIEKLYAKSLRLC